MKTNIFVSYTLKGNRLSKHKLNELKKALTTLDFLSLYIDILDNNCSASPQSEVIYRLLKSDIVWVIFCDEVLKSEWVIKEIKLAKKHNKPIHHISISTMNNLIVAQDDSKKLNILRTFI